MITKLKPCPTDSDARALVLHTWLPGARYALESVKVGYKINFNGYFYKPKTLRALEEIRTNLLAVQKDAEGMINEILGG